MVNQLELETIAGANYTPSLQYLVNYLGISVETIFMKNLRRILLLLAGSSLLQGCILLLPVIEKNQAAEKAQAKAPGKVCPITGELRPDLTANLALIDEAQLFVAAHQPQRHQRPSAKVRLATLVNQLRSGSEIARTHAATDIGMMGFKNSSAIEALSHSVRYDDSKWVRRSAVKSLAMISGQEVIAPLESALKDRDKWVVHSANNALRKVRRQIATSPSNKPLSPLKSVVYRAN